MTHGDGKTAEIEIATDAPVRMRQRTMMRFLWGTVIVAIVIPLVLVLAAMLRARTETAPEVPPTLFAQFVGVAGQKAAEQTVTQVNALLDAVYTPVYAAIPAYADFHYSVLGEYTELGAAALGQMGGVIEKRLFAGFEQRLQESGVKIEALFMEEYRRALHEQVEQFIPAESRHLPLGALTSAALEDAQERLRYTAPIGAIAAIGVGGGAVKALSLAFAKKIAAKVGAKATLKGAAKGAGVLGGAGGGALACSWSGPFAAACGVAGGVAAWLIADTAIISLDEYFNRDEFEQDLHRMISEDRALRRTQIQAAIHQKAARLDEALQEQITLREHAERTRPAQ